MTKTPHLLVQSMIASISKMPSFVRRLCSVLEFADSANHGAVIMRQAVQCVWCHGPCLWCMQHHIPDTCWVYLSLGYQHNWSWWLVRRGGSWSDSSTHTWIAVFDCSQLTAPSPNQWRECQQSYSAQNSGVMITIESLCVFLLISFIKAWGCHIEQVYTHVPTFLAWNFYAGLTILIF